MEIIPVVLCGGRGKRLAPYSTNRAPKQFFKLNSAHSLLQETLLRLRHSHSNFITHKPLLLTNHKYLKVLRSQLKEIGFHDVTLLVEPMIKDTAISTLLASMHLYNLYQDDAPIILLLPTDHYIQDLEPFFKTLREGAECLQHNPNRILTFGVEAIAIETRYGYIKRGRYEGDNLYHINHFIEKPNSAVATLLLQQPDYYWNSGIYMFNAKEMMRTFAKLNKVMYRQCAQALTRALHKHSTLLIPKFQQFSSIRPKSFDRAIVEKSNNVMMKILDIHWTDLGHWPAILNHLNRLECAAKAS